MKDVLRVVGNILLYVFAIVVILWTASLTISLVSRLLPGDGITPYFALALFDGGALVWLVVFIGKAAGLFQRAVSILMTAIDLLGVVLMSIGELFLGGQQLTAIPESLGTIVVYAVGLWTAVNLIAIYMFHIGDPAVSQEIELRTEQDKIEGEAMAQARARLQARSVALGNRLADRLERQAMYNLRLDDGAGETEPFDASDQPVSTGKRRLSLGQLSWSNRRKPAKKVPRPLHLSGLYVGEPKPEEPEEPEGNPT